MSAIYNEIDPFAASWLERLINHGHIAKGEVDRRSISDLTPADVAGLGQRHFFAGIAGWSHALRLAGVPDDADIWTGSCPCQPFSDAGKRSGTSDSRHLWPAWSALIRECRPPVIFGEQVASKDGLGWLDLVFADMERCGYAVGAADLCAASVGAPHIRQRLFFVAYADGKRLKGLRLRLQQRGSQSTSVEAERYGEAGGMAYANVSRSQRRSVGRDGADQRNARSRRMAGRMADTASDGWSEGIDSGQAGAHRGTGSADRSRSGGSINPERTSAANPWSGCDWIPCSDGVSRPVEPGTHPLASGIPNRVGLLRGYGNSIVPQVAAAFIRASLESIL